MMNAMGAAPRRRLRSVCQHVGGGPGGGSGGGVASEHTSLTSVLGGAAGLAVGWEAYRRLTTAAHRAPTDLQALIAATEP